MRLALRIPLLLTVMLLGAFSASKRHHPRSAGIYVQLPADSPRLGFSNLVLTISKQYSVKINYDPVPIESLADRFKVRYGLRYKHVLLIRADPDVNFQEVMDVIDVAQGAVADMQLVVITPRAKKNMLRLPEGLTKLD
jgi:biopolymer transport protein ExbD